MPCWRETPSIDVFDDAGRYLGPVPLPAGLWLSPRAWIDGRTVIATLVDDAGIVMVKRYRLVPPGEDMP
jgi:hypothetical protein